MINNLQIERVKFSSVFTWMIAGAIMLRQNPLPLMTISLVFLLLFVIIFGVGNHFITSTYAATAVTFVLSMILPFLLAAITFAYRELTFGVTINIRKLGYNLLSGFNLRLILVYVLLLLFCSFGFNYLVNIYDINNQWFNYGGQAIFIVLQFIIFLAVPYNIYATDKKRPFGTLWISLKALCINIIPCLLFTILVFLLLAMVILAANFVATFAGRLALGVYFIGLWVFITWLCLSAIAMAQSIFAYHK